MSHLYVSVVSEIGNKNVQILLEEIAKSQNIEKPIDENASLYLVLYDKLRDKLDQLLRTAYTRHVLKETEILNKKCDGTIIAREAELNFMTYVADKDCLMACDRFRSRFMYRLLEFITHGKYVPEYIEIFRKNNDLIFKHEKKNFNCDIGKLVEGEEALKEAPKPYTIAELQDIINAANALPTGPEKVEKIKAFLDALLATPETLKIPQVARMVSVKLMEYMRHKTYGVQYKPYYAKFKAIIPEYVNDLALLTSCLDPTKKD